MRKLLVFSAAIASALAMNVARADFILVDDFNLPTTPVSCDAILGTDCNFVAQPLAAGGLASVRNVKTVVSSELAGGSVDNHKYNVSVGGGTGNPSGVLSMNQGSKVLGTTLVSWTIPTGQTQPTGPYQMFFQVAASTAGQGVNTTIQFSFTDLSSATTNIGALLSIPSSAATNTGFGLSQADANKIYGGGVLKMLVTGNYGMNLDLDQFSIFIPEPTSLSLVGLALLGAGLVARRRKA